MSISFKKSGKLGGIRKRESDQGEQDSDETAVIKRDRKKDTVLSFQTGSAKQAKVVNDGDDDEDDESERNSGSKFTKLDKMQAKIELGLAYASKRTTDSAVSRETLATAANEIDTEADRDAQAIYERTQKLWKTLEAEKDGEKSKSGSTSANNKSEGDEKVYRGRAGYKQYVEVRDTSVANASSAMVRGGQIRAPSNVRMSTRWDYQPDLCKDYNETGYCVFGDSCKFLHDRTDYKHGWQLEREQAGGNSNDDVSYEIRDDEESLPFKCLLCRDSFRQPVVTKCGHYFCEKCALQHNRKSTRCYVCGRPTEGVFRVATKILERLNAQRKARDEERRLARIEDDDEEELEQEEQEHQHDEHEVSCCDHDHSAPHQKGNVADDRERKSDSSASDDESTSNDRSRGGNADSAKAHDLDVPIEQELDDAAEGSDDESDSDSDDN